MFDRVTFAVGDVHGRLDLLRIAAESVRRQALAREARVVLLGDYVDRGPDSCGVVEFLIRWQAENPHVVCLKGNHEEMMVRALTGSRDDLEVWLANGGAETLRSYGVVQVDEPLPPRLREHLRWIEALPLTSGDPHRIYVHAGLAPSTPVEAQDARTVLWIRERFLRARAKQFERHVVHGHTPLWAGKPDMGAPELLEHRTNLDTGAYLTGVLTVGVFADQAPGGPITVISIAAGADGRPLIRMRNAQELGRELPPAHTAAAAGERPLPPTRPGGGIRRLRFFR